MVIQGEYSHSQQSLDVGSALPDVQQHYPESGLIGGENIYSNADLQSQHSAHVDHSYESRLAALPAYRPAPDYDSVMRQRMLQQALQQQHHSDPQQPQQLAQPASQQELLHLQTSNLGNAQVYSQAQTIAYSQPEIREHQYQQQDNIYANVGPGYMQYRVGDRATSQIIHPTYSTPELYAQLLAEDYSNGAVMGEALPFHYKPPPPYPRASNSTPDLAIQTVKSGLTESPDLVSRRNIGMADLVDQSRLDHSVENLAEEFQQSANMNSDTNSAIYMKPIVSSEQVEEVSLEEAVSTSPQSLDSTVVEEGSLTLSPLVKQTPQRLSDKSSHQSPYDKKTKVQIKYVSPSQAPPQCTSAEVATRRESFRRQVIANSPYFDPRTSIRRSHKREAVNQAALPTITDSTLPSGGDHKSPAGGNATGVETENVESNCTGAEQVLLDSPQEVRMVTIQRFSCLNGLSCFSLQYFRKKFCFRLLS